MKMVLFVNIHADIPRRYGFAESIRISDRRVSKKRTLR